MVYRLRPLESELDFEDRPYKLGETVRLTVAINPKSDVRVREARVDLLCEERYLENSTFSMEVPIFQQVSTGRGSRPVQIGTETVTKQVNKEQKEKHIHSSVVFASDAELRSGRPQRFGVDLDIEPVPPAHAADAKALVKDPSRSWSFRWTLVATVNVVRGRNPKKQRKVQIAFN